jgi:hypothetical protein
MTSAQVWPRIAAACVLVLAGCAREPALPDGYVVGLEPIEDSLCLAYDTAEQTVWWWDGGGPDCLTASSSLQDAATDVAPGSLRLPSLRVTFSMAVIPSGTRSAEVTLAEEEGVLYFLTEDRRMIPTTVMRELDISGP